MGSFLVVKGIVVVVAGICVVVGGRVSGGAVVGLMGGTAAGGLKSHSLSVMIMSSIAASPRQSDPIVPDMMIYREIKMKF